MKKRDKKKRNKRPTIKNSNDQQNSSRRAVPFARSQKSQR